MDVDSTNRILILTHEFLPYPGGIATYTNELAHAAHRLGHQITLLAPGYGKQLSPQDIENYPFKVIRFPGGLYGHLKGLPGLIWRTWHYANPREYDLIHAVDWPYIMALAFINKFKRVPFIATVHGTEILRMPVVKQVRMLGVNDLFVRPDQVFTNSQFTRRLLLDHFPEVNEGKVKVSLLAADTYWFQSVDSVNAQQVRQRYNIPYDDRIILTVSRLEQRKGHRLVLQALQGLHGSLKKGITYVITGETASQAYFEELQRLAAASDVRVIFTGAIPRDDVRALYSTAYLYCMPGEPLERRVEGFGLVYLEAAAQGLPSIASNMAAMPEVIRDAETGILVSPMNVTALIEALERLLYNPELQTTLGRAARRWAETFSWERCAREIYDI